VATALAAAVIATVVPVRAGPFERLDDAQVRVRELAARLDAQARELASAREALGALDDGIAAAASAMADLQGARVELERELAETERTYGLARATLGAVVADAFMAAGPGSADVGVLGALLGSEDVSDLDDRVVYGSAAGEEAVELASEVERVHEHLAERRSELDALVSARAAAVDDLEGLRSDREAAVSDAASALAALDAVRDEAVVLVRSLERELFGVGDVDLSALGDALQGEHHVPYGRWAGLFLSMFDAPTCRNNIVVVVAWQVAESTQAAWNPLATTHRMEGSTDFNSVGVQDFVSLEQGLLATRETIVNGWDVYRYGAIARSLRGCADPMATALAINASSWCPGCVGGQYVLNVVPRVDEDLAAYVQL
jgi:predicted  nucleic acid-binding Zn-ribbon protein